VEMATDSIDRILQFRDRVRRMQLALQEADVEAGMRCVQNLGGIVAAERARRKRIDEYVGCIGATWSIPIGIEAADSLLLAQRLLFVQHTADALAAGQFLHSCEIGPHGDDALLVWAGVTLYHHARSSFWAS